MAEGGGQGEGEPPINKAVQPRQSYPCKCSRVLRWRFQHIFHISNDRDSARDMLAGRLMGTLKNDGILELTEAKK